MAKTTVESIILSKLDKLEERVVYLIDAVGGLKAKAAVAGGAAGLVGAAIAAYVTNFWK
jgi:CRISPR/Cas system-associated protein Csm6